MPAKTVLVATSDHLLSEKYRIALTQRGYVVREAFDGDEALDHAQSDAPSLLILDAKLEKRDGFEVLEDLRTEPAFRLVPVLIITDMGSDAERAKAEALGGGELIVKGRHEASDVADMAQAAMGEEAGRKPLQESSAPPSATLGQVPDADSDSLLGSDAEAETETEDTSAASEQDAHVASEPESPSESDAKS